MTDRETCEKIEKELSCLFIGSCSDCPLNDKCRNRTPYEHMVVVRFAREWLAEHTVACDYCRDDFGKQIIDKFGMDVYVFKKMIVGSYCDDDGHIIEADAPIAYCPVCGRKLEGV